MHMSIQYIMSIMRKELQTLRSYTMYSCYCMFIVPIKKKATSFKGCHESVCLHLFDFFHFKYFICKQKSIMQSMYL